MFAPFVSLTKSTEAITSFQHLTLITVPCFRFVIMTGYLRQMTSVNFSSFLYLTMQPYCLFTSPQLCQLGIKCVVLLETFDFSYLPYTVFENMKTFLYFLERDMEDKKDKTER